MFTHCFTNCTRRVARKTRNARKGHVRSRCRSCGGPPSLVRVDGAAGLLPEVVLVRDEWLRKAISAGHMDVDLTHTLSLSLSRSLSLSLSLSLFFFVHVFLSLLLSGHFHPSFPFLSFPFLPFPSRSSSPAETKIVPSRGRLRCRRATARGKHGKARLYFLDSPDDWVKPVKP